MAHFRLFAAYTGLITVTFLLGGGVLGDLYGRRRVLPIGLAGYIAGNLLAMSVPQPFRHLFARVVSPLPLARLPFPSRSP